MENPFETIARRLSNIEDLLLDLKHKPAQNNAPDTEPYGDFNWLKATCFGVPASTLRIHSAAGKIPGVVKFGKRVLYEKASVLNWLRSQTSAGIDSQPLPDAAELDRIAEEQISNRLARTSRQQPRPSKKGTV